MRKNDKKPSIRFKGYTDPWEQRKVGDYYDFKNGLNKGKEFFGEGTPIVNFTDVFHNRGIIPEKLKGKVRLEQSEINNFRVRKGDIFFTRTSETIDEIGYPSVMLEEPENTVFSGFVLRGRTILSEDPLDDLFKEYVFFTKAFRDEMMSKSSMTTRALTSGTAIKGMTFFHPMDKAEQHAIGKLITNLDNLITLHQRKYEKFVRVKKSMLIKMFPRDGQTVPEIRFSGFTDPWEQRELGKAFDMTIPNNTLARAELNYEHGEIKSVHYGDVLIKYGAFLDAQNDTIPYITDGTLSQYKGHLLQDGDIIFADTAEDETTGKAAEIGNIGSNSVVSGLHTIVCRPIEKKAKYYLGYYLNSDAFHHQLLPLMQGIKVLSLSRSNLAKTQIMYPKNEDEQSQIGMFFHSLDELITLHQRKLEKLKNIKKSLLEKMFV